MSTGLKFAEKTHRYWLDGQPIPGVTTLLSKGLPKPALMYWSARTVAEFVADNPETVEAFRASGRGPMVAALKEVPWQKRDEAAVRGTDVHALAEKLAHGVEVDVPAHLVDHVEGFARWLDAFDVETLHSETGIANRTAWYAGRFDAIIRFGRGPWAGRIVMSDNKTSSGVYGETALQTAAYARAEEMYPDAAPEGVPLPDITATGVAHITEHGTVFHPLCNDPGEIDEAFALFRHIAWVAQKADWIKDRVGDAFPEPDGDAA